MGYELHITRAEDWVESDPITLRQWLDYVSADPDMRLDGFAEVETPDGTLRAEDESIAVWTAWSRDGVGGNHAWFEHFEGCISVKNPDDEIIAKMLDIAAHFQAKVVGDEGESYPHALPTHRSPVRKDGKRPWWRFWC